MTEATIYHLVPLARWRGHDPSEPYYPPTYEADGFIHATAERELLRHIANHFYRDSVGDWLCLEISLAKLEQAGIEVPFEAPAAVGETPANIPGINPTHRFPHIYGGLQPEMIVAEHRVVRDADGRFIAIGE